MKRIRTARGRKASSTRWLERQLNDPYVQRAKAENYRSRAAYKLLELDEKFGLLKGVKRHFATVKHAKPPASRKDSSEWYVIAQGFKGGEVLND